MKVIYCYQTPKEGDTLILEEWILGRHDVSKEPVGNVHVVKVETRTVPEWNPVLNKRQGVKHIYVTLDWNGKLYVRRCLVNGS